MSDYLLRSLMFVPSHDDTMLEISSRSNADCLLLDLEDSVTLVSNKQIGRDNIVKWVNEGKFKNHLVIPRINDRESGQLLKDVYQLTIPGIHGFMFPKSKQGKDVYFIDQLLETIEYEKGFEIGTFKLIPLLETTNAVLNAEEICYASKRVIAVAFGSEDFITDLEGIHDKENISIFTPRAIIAMAARAAKVVPIDTVHTNVHDLNDLEVNIKIAKKLGFEGMLVLNPKELPYVHQYFSPTKQEVKDAEEILDLFKEVSYNNQGVAIKKGKFIGPPIVLAAKKVLKKNELIKIKNTNQV